MVLISLQVRKTVRSRALFLCSIVFSLGVLFKLQLAAIALGAATPSSPWRLPSCPCSPYAGVTSHASASCVRLLQVDRDVLRARWMWTRTSVYRHYSRARCTGGRTPAGEDDVVSSQEEEHLLTRRKTMMCRHKKTNDLEREKNMYLVMI